MESIEQPDHSAITGRILRIRTYLKSTLATGKEAPLVLYGEKNKLALCQGQQELIFEHDVSWQHSKGLAMEQGNWYVFGDEEDENDLPFKNYVQHKH